MTVLAFDFGLKHIGIATVEPRVGTANGLTRIRANDGQPQWDALDRVFSEWRPERAVVGLPLNMDGTESDMSAAARRFGRRLAAHYAIPIEYADERLSTFEAETEGAAKEASHAAAARIIGETWLGSGGHPDET
ncbi:MAG: Holliday junction resolvase RuvX [Gammaproteobacteria bacterium]|nr:Holliday junction resolvase RuvX [Gammaproteobacteria bacterium]